MQRIKMILSRPVPPVLGTILRFAVYFALVAAVLAGSSTLGFTDDESGYVALNTEEFAAHPFFPYLTRIDVGHPMNYAWLGGLFWRLFGHGNTVIYLYMWGYGALALLATDRLTDALLRRGLGCKTPVWGGPLAALGLFSLPLFISYVTQYLDAVPYVAFLLLMVLAWVRGWRGWMAFWGLMLSLTRITGVFGYLGFGLFDIAHGWAARRRRSARQVLRQAAPHLAAAALYGLYWFGKLVVFKLPFNTFKKNGFHFNDLKMTLFYFKFITQTHIPYPAWSVSVLLWVAAAALLAAGARRLWRWRTGVQPPAVEGAPDDGPGTAAIYGALFCALILWTLFYFVYFMSPNGRWFLSWQAVLVIAGVHGLVMLLGPWRSLALPLLLLWCELQCLRWHRDWTQGFRPFARIKNVKFFPGIIYSLDVNRRKEIIHATVDWVTEHTREAALINGYPMGSAFFMPIAGFTHSRFKGLTDFSVLAKSANPHATLESLARKWGEVYYITGNWDQSNHQFAKGFEALCAREPFSLVFERRTGGGDEIRIFKWMGAAAGAKTEKSALASQSRVRK